MPYDKDDMNAAVKYFQETKKKFLENKEEAYKMYLADPNGSKVTFEFFCQHMQILTEKME